MSASSESMATTLLLRRQVQIDPVLIIVNAMVSQITGNPNNTAQLNVNHIYNAHTYIYIYIYILCNVCQEQSSKQNSTMSLNVCSSCKACKPCSYYMWLHFFLVCVCLCFKYPSFTSINYSSHTVIFTLSTLYYHVLSVQFRFFCLKNSSCFVLNPHVIT